MAQEIEKKFRETIARNFADIRKDWMQLSKESLLSSANEIVAVQLMAKELPEHVSEGDMARLLKFQNPLQLVSDYWISMNGSDSLVVDDDLGYILWKIANEEGLEETYETAEGDEQASGTQTM